MRWIVLSLVLAGCAASLAKEPNYTAAERCSRVYAENINRIYNNARASKWTVEQAIDVEIASVLQDGEPLNPELRAVIVHAIVFVYANANRGWSNADMRAAYAAECEWRLRSKA